MAGVLAVFASSASALAVTPMLFLSTVASVSAQHRFSKTYPVPRNARLMIKNYSGAIRVEVGLKNEVKVVADMETRAVKLVPEVTDDGIVINVVKDNAGRSDFGDVNFRIILPAGLTVDVETKRGDITVRDVSGQMVRAKVTLDGDIELTGLRVATVLAENMIGNILFDGELIPGGKYRLESTKGNINVRVPGDSSFWLMAFAPTTRSIDLGGFAGRLDHSDNRRVIGNMGGGDRVVVNGQESSRPNLLQTSLTNESTSSLRRCGARA
ncbi:MAG: hypothetical protein WKF84_28870 [Pyrinomonadaceae bacterium]